LDFNFIMNKRTDIINIILNTQDTQEEQLKYFISLITVQSPSRNNRKIMKDDISPHEEYKEPTSNLKKKIEPFILFVCAFYNK